MVQRISHRICVPTKLENLFLTLLDNQVEVFIRLNQKKSIEEPEHVLDNSNSEAQVFSSC